MHDENEIVALIRNGFINLFSTKAVSALRNAWSLSTWLSFIDDEDVSMLNANLTRQEVKKGIWGLKPWGLMVSMQDSSSPIGIRWGT